MSAWANAANAAMLADAFRIAGNTTLSDQYKASAVEAWGVARLCRPMLDQTDRRRRKRARPQDDGGRFSLSTSQAIRHTKP